MSERISRDKFLAFARTLEGQELTTRTQHQPFMVSVIGGALVFVPGSTGKPRPESSGGLDRILAQFATSGSLRPRDYQLTTRNASYVLMLMALYLERADGPSKGSLQERR